MGVLKAKGKKQLMLKNVNLNMRKSLLNTFVTVLKNNCEEIYMYLYTEKMTFMISCMWLRSYN